MEEAPTSVTSESLKKEPETLDEKVEETEAQQQTIMSESEGGGAESSSSKTGVSSPTVDEDSNKTLERASELMEKGSKAMKDGDFTEAAECFSRAVEIKVACFGELSPECSSAYYKYGCALLYKAQEEADPLGVVPKKESDSLQNSDKSSSVKSVKDEHSASSSVSDAKEDGVSIHNQGEQDEGAGEKDQVEDDDEGSEGEDVAEEPDEDDSDLDLAWKMLDLARAIAEKNPNDTMEKVDILSALGEVALEREDIETSLSDYLNALAILERLVEPDSRQIAELNFRICLVLEVGSKPEEAVPYCQKAISVCKSRLRRLTGEVKSSASSTSTVIVPDTQQNVDPAVGGSQSSSASDKEAEIETLSGLSSELEKKLEDLQQLVLHPTSILADVLKMVAARSTGNDKNATSSTILSSQKGMNASSGDLDSPTVSTAHTNGSGGVTHLGVVGRGVKRVLMTPENAEPSTVKKPTPENAEPSTVKKPTLGLNSEKSEGGSS
ncbi:Tetratricopeptide repeat [Macleaya cordata]|uniref:Tetratricopeptide repeat n=1 Tax=Macleaya cordata TaxID=56857 RepID=A0A200R7A6_MACCD|nr:Tetratricopeptide repeat [Macleaya cordata]